MESRLFDAPPVHVTPDWYAGREAAPHLEQDGHRQRLELSVAMIHSLPDVHSVLDLGAGDGGLLSLLGADYDAIGYDLQQTNVDAAKARGVNVRYGDVLELDLPSVDLVVCTEMLEHLIEPHALLERIHASGSRYLVASSPYQETVEFHYEFHTWAWDEVGYRAMVEAAGYRVLRQETVWIAQVLLAERVQR